MLPRDIPVPKMARGTKWAMRLTSWVLPLLASGDVTSKIGLCTAATSCTHANIIHSATVNAWSSFRMT